MSGVEKKTCPEHDRYLIDDKNLVWDTPNDSKPVPAVPRSMVPEYLALVHTLYGHAGVGATLASVRNHFHWPTKITTMPGRTVSNKYILLVIDRVSRFLFILANLGLTSGVPRTPVVTVEVNSGQKY